MDLTLTRWLSLLGKKVVGFRGVKGNKKQKEIEATSILFDDEESFIELREQDQYDYHDCDSYARRITLTKDKKLWKRMFDKEGGFEEANTINFDI